MHSNPLPSITRFLLPLYLLTGYFHTANAAIEEIEATPTNTNAVELGDVSMPQFLVLCVVFLIIVTLYGVGVIPIEIDLGYFYGTGSGALLPREIGNNKVDFVTVFHDCPFQYVCELDMWANRDDHEFFASKMVASWFKNPTSKFMNAENAAFGGAGTCKEMYPCPFDLPAILGLRSRASSRNATSPYDFDSLADIHTDLTA